MTESPAFELRWYQRESVDAFYDHVRTRTDNPCIVLPTGSGKTPVIAQIATDCISLWNRRVLILAHVKELLEQSYETLRRFAPQLNVGMYSAGLNRRESRASVIVAGIQSVYKLAGELGPFDLAIIDEAHLIPPDGEGRYRSFLADAKLVNPKLRLLGLTATPYRLGTGRICAPEHLLNHVCYEAPIGRLMEDGFLCRLVPKCSRRSVDMSAARINGGEYVPSSVEAILDGELGRVVADMVGRCESRKSILVFCAGVANGKRVAQLLAEHNEAVAEIYGDTFDGIRTASINDFRAGSVRWLVNVNVLTTGFDATNVDAVVHLRPTCSPGLWYQMNGRGLRIDEKKTDCLVLDYVGNLKRHGPIDQIDPMKSSGGVTPMQTCPECDAFILAAFCDCPQCNHHIRDASVPFSSVEYSLEPEVAPVVTVEPIEYDVRRTEYSVHQKKGAAENSPRSMRVSYEIGWNRFVSEWVCFEHEGYAAEKAAAWWRQRSPDPIPQSAEHAVDAANNGGLCETLKITVNHQDKSGFDRIVKYKLGPCPEPMDGPKETILEMYADVPLPF